MTDLAAKLIIQDEAGNVLDTKEPWLGWFDKDQKALWLHGVEQRPIIIWIEDMTSKVTTVTVGPPHPQTAKALQP